MDDTDCPAALITTFLASVEIQEVSMLMALRAFLGVGVVVAGILVKVGSATWVSEVIQHLLSLGSYGS